MSSDLLTVKFHIEYFNDVPIIEHVGYSNDVNMVSGWVENTDSFRETEAIFKSHYYMSNNVSRVLF